MQCFVVMSTHGQAEGEYQLRHAGRGSFAVLAATFLIGIALIIRHEVYADNGQEKGEDL